MNKITLSLGGFYYFNFSLLEQLNFIKKLKNFNGVEIHIKHGYKFSDDEIKELRKYKYNTLHLNGYIETDKQWLKYCIKNIPNFQHFVLHPDSIKLDNITNDIEKYISFENMDSNKCCYKSAVEMNDLFDIFPKSKFTLDINHLEDNDINLNDFNVIKKPNQIHFSVLNKNYYNNPEIQTKHALACLSNNFIFNFNNYRNCIITIEGVFIPNKVDLIQKEIDLIYYGLQKES